MTVDLYIAALPAISADLHASKAAVQLTLTGSLAGLASGQLLVGPLSDAWGRRRPMVVALTGYLLASLLCAAATSVDLLVAARAVQGLTGGAALVLTLATVRDLYPGRETARLLSRLTLITGLAPIVAPALGSGVLRVTSWRGVFVLLSLIGCVLLVAVVRHLPESLPPRRRSGDGIFATTVAAGRLFLEPAFLGLSVSGALLLGAMFAYIAESPFVYQQELGLTPQQFGLVFGLNAAGIVVGGQLNAWLLTRVRHLDTVVTGAVVVMVLGAGGVLTCATQGWLGLWGLNASVLTMMMALGVAMPTSTGLALLRHPDIAGSASAVLGSSRFLAAALSAPLVGAVGGAGAVPMAVVMAGTTSAALLTLVCVGRPWLLREEDSALDAPRSTF